MTDKLTPNEVQAIVEGVMTAKNAVLSRNNTSAPKITQSMTLSLTTAKLDTSPLEIKFPFTSVYVSDCSDAATEVNIRFNDRAGDDLPLSKKDVINFDYPMANAYINWSAQPNKTITLIFMTEGQIKTGSQTSEVSSSVEANSISNLACQSITTIAKILSQDLNAKVINIYNDGPDTVFIGATGVAKATGATAGVTTVGMPILAGGERQYKNTAEIYAISEGTSLLYIQKES